MASNTQFLMGLPNPFKNPAPSRLPGSHKDRVSTRPSASQKIPTSGRLAGKSHVSQKTRGSNKNLKVARTSKGISKSPTTFTLFNKLPLETRQHIWRDAAEADRAIIAIGRGGGCLAGFKCLTASRSRHGVPPLLHVCRESRFECERMAYWQQAFIDTHLGSPVSSQLRRLYWRAGFDTIRVLDNSINEFLSTGYAPTTKHIVLDGGSGRFGRLNHQDLLRLKDSLPSLEKVTILMYSSGGTISRRPEPLGGFAAEKDGGLNPHGLQDSFLKVETSRQIERWLNPARLSPPEQQRFKEVVKMIKFRFERQFEEAEGITRVDTEAAHFRMRLELLPPVDRQRM